MFSLIKLLSFTLIIFRELNTMKCYMLIEQGILITVYDKYQAIKGLFIQLESLKNHQSHPFA